MSDSGAPGGTRDGLAGSILRAALQAMTDQRALDVSLRAVAARAGVTPSLVAYHFTSRSRLIAAAFQAALPEFGAHLGRLAGLRRNADGPEAVAELASSWTLAVGRDSPSLVRLWGDLLLGAAREPELRPVALAWATEWRRAWQGMSSRPDILAEFAAFELLYAGALPGLAEHDLIVREAFRRVVKRLHGRRLEREDLRWHTLLCHEPMESPPAADLAEAPLKNRIIDAAADLIGSEGTVAATHRAVAARAGASLSSMTYHFDSRAEIVREGLLRIFQRAMPPVEPAAPADGAGALGVEGLLARASREPGGRVGSRLAMVRAIGEVAQEASLDPNFRPIAAELRSIRGLVTRGTLATLLGRGLPERADAADFAVWESGAALLRDAEQPDPSAEASRLDGAVRLFFPATT